MTTLSPVELELIRLEFQHFDATGTGELNNVEVTKLFKHLNPNIAKWEIENAIRRFDMNNDGQISYPDFVEIHQIQKQEREKIDEENILRHFQTLDYNQDGSISHDEITNFMNFIQKGTNCEHFFQALQSSHEQSPNDEIDFELFREAVRTHNRTLEQDIARHKVNQYQITKRLMKFKLQHMRQKIKFGRNSLYPLIPLLKVQHQEIDQAVARCQENLITVDNQVFASSFQNIVGQYQIQQSIYSRFEAFVTSLGCRSAGSDDMSVFRTFLERAETSSPLYLISDRVLSSPVPGITDQPDYRVWCESILSMNACPMKHTSWTTEWVYYRRCFLHYAMMSNPFQLQTLSLRYFLRFLRDYDLVSAQDEARVEFRLAEILTVPGMKLSFADFVAMMSIVFQWKCPETAQDSTQTMFQRWILPKAKHDFPSSDFDQDDLQQGPLQELMRQMIWPFKMIFDTLTEQRLTLANHLAPRRLTRSQFLKFVRVFPIVPRLSLAEVMREFAYAQWDLQSQSIITMDTPLVTQSSLSRREFFRCLQRLSYLTTSSSSSSSSKTKGVSRPEMLFHGGKKVHVERARHFVHLEQEQEPVIERTLSPDRCLPRQAHGNVKLSFVPPCTNASRPLRLGGSPRTRQLLMKSPRGAKIPHPPPTQSSKSMCISRKKMVVNTTARSRDDTHDLRIQDFQVNFNAAPTCMVSPHREVT